jgi:hypothetical protein
MTCYVDSGVGATAPTGKDAPRKIQGDAQLGAHPWLKDEGRTAIEELRIYPRMLTPHEVRQRYGEFNRLAGAAR